MRNAGLEEAQAAIKIAGRNINNLRYANDTTLKAEREEELKSLLMKMEEESEKVGLKLKPVRKLKPVLLGFLLPWTWGISSRLLQQSEALLLILDEGYLLTAAPPDLECGVAPLTPSAPCTR